MIKRDGDMKKSLADLSDPTLCTHSSHSGQKTDSEKINLQVPCCEQSFDSFFQTVFGVAPVPMLLVGSGLELLTVNKAFESLSGISAGEATILSLEALLSGPVFQSLQLLENSHGPIDTSLTCRNGTALPVTCTASRFCHDQRNYCLLTLDKNEHLQSQPAFQQAEVLFQILDAAPIGLIFFTPEKLIWHNRQFATMLGFDGEKINLEQLQSSFENGKQFKQATGYSETFPPIYEITQVGVPMRRSDGSAFEAMWSRFRADLPSLPSGIFAGVSDRTKFKHSEDALLRARRRFSSILQDIPLIAITLDQNGKIIFANDFFLALTGWTREEVLEKNWVNTFVAPSDKKIIRIAFDKSFSERSLNQVPSYYSRIVTRRGEELMISWYNVTNKYHPRDHIEILCLGVDITERQRAEQELLRAKEIAEEANKAKNDFLADMSHEVRMPLQSILGMLQVLDATILTDEQAHFVRAALASGRNLTRLLSDILDLSRAESGEISLSEDAFSVHDTLHELKDAYSEIAKRKGIKLQVYEDPNIPEQLIGDQLRVLQLLQNLVGNAVKFTEKGKVSLGAYCRESSTTDNIRILFTVSDTGIGIPEHKVDSIFDSFMQIETAYTQKVQGMGLGLQLVKRLVDLLGGEIVVDSKVGMGTTFNCVLDFKTLSSMNQNAVENDACSNHLTGRVLLAEDDAVNRIAVQRFLEKKGLEVFCVSNGLDALRAMEKENFDCVLMDIQMPLMNGVEVTRRIRAVKHIGNRSNVPIIALTAYAMEGDKEAFLSSGLNDYIAKPVAMKDLLKTIENALKTQR